MKTTFTSLFTTQKWLLVIVLFACGWQASWGQIYVHDFGTAAISTHPYIVAPTTFNANLSTSSWSNSTTTWTNFAGSTGQAISLSNSGGIPTITLTFNVSAGFQLEITSYSFWRQRSTTGAQNWSMTINSNAVGSGTVPTAGAGTGNITTGLPLSNLTGTVTVVMSLSGASGTGTFRLDDFTLNGSVTSTTTPTITLSSPSQITAGNIAQCSTNNALSAFQAAVTVSSATLNSVVATTAGTYSVSSHLSNFKLLYFTSNTFASAAQIGTTQASAASGGNITFSGLTHVIASGNTGFFWIVADVNASATTTQTINITASPTLTFASGTPTGSITVGGIQTITTTAPSNPTGVSASSGNAQSIVAWTNPTCFEEIMIVGKQGTFTGTLPTGDGTAYTANLAYGSGTGFDGGFVVYKGSTSSQTITNLTNCLAYEFKVFTRKGSTWSSGVTVSSNPTTTSSASDVVGVASSEANTISSILNTATISSSTDGVQVWQFTIRDGGGTNDADCLPTIVNSIVLTQGVGNGVTVWTNIQSIAIFNGTTFLANGTIGASSITFTNAPLISVPDNGSVTLSIRLSLKSTLTIQATADNLDFVFGLTSANFTTASPATSSQKAPATFPINSTDTKNAIEVIATKLGFITQTSNSTVGAPMTSPTIQATDANGNRDRDYVTSISVTSTGTLNSTPQTATPASGLASTWSIVHTVSGTGLTLTASSGILTNAVSNTFNISTVINSETFATCGSLTWNAVNVLGATDVWSCGTSQMLMNGFGSENDEDWLIVGTPINFNAYANESMAFVTRERYDGPNLQLYYSTDFSGTFDASNVSSATWTLIPHTWNDASTSATLSAIFNNTVNLSALTGTAYIAFKYTGTSSSAEEWIVDNIAITGNITGAILNATPTTRTGFTYAQGAGPSTSQSFNLSGANLTPAADDITLVPSTNYEISTDNSTFTSSSILVAYTGSALASTPIYIRLKAGLTVGSYNSELINVSGGGASAVDVTCSGSVFLMPQVALSSANPAVSASNIVQNTTNNVIYKFELAVTDATATLTNISFTTAGTYAASNLTNIKLWYSPDATFTGSGNDVSLRSKTTNLKTNPQTFTAFSQTITLGTTGYFFLTTDLPCTATDGNTISVNALTTADITVSLGNKSGTAFASDAQTITSATPVNVTSQTTSSCQSTGTTVSWATPTSCSDNVLVFATSGSFTATLPTGNGGSYTANTAFGSGTAFDGGFCVFKGTGTTVSVTGLTNGTAYSYKIFTRNGTNWSSGVTASCTPTIGYCTSNGNTSFTTGVTNVVFNTINNADVTKTAPYSDFTAISTTVLQGATHNLTTNVNTAGNFTVYVKTWVDWNQDGDFADSGEEYDLGTATNVTDGITNLSPLSITVPIGATLGTTRMRVSARFNSAPISCGTAFDGEVEDYTVVVTSACTPVHTISSFVPTSGPTGTLVTITGTGFTASSTVKFGTITATSVTFSSSTQIVAEVPTGFTTANIKVTESACDVNFGTTYTRPDFSGVCGAILSNLIISELYDKETGSLGYIELYNGTGATIDLTGYSIKRFNDNAGSVTHTYTFPASGAGSSITHGQVLVGKVSSEANVGGITPHFTFTGSTAGYNELDRLELWSGASEIDEVIAQGVDVGYSYFRNSNVTGPNTTFTSSEWTFVSTEVSTDLGLFLTTSPPTISIITDASNCSLVDMTVTATATNGGALTYKWFYNDRIATGWTEVNTTNLPNFTLTGQTTNNLKIADNIQFVSSISTYQFYCEVTENTTCIKLSNASPFTTSSRPVYRSKAGTTGNWSVSTNWEMANSTAGPWINACTYPVASNSTEVIIQNGTNITLDADVAIDKITIDSGGTFEISPNIKLTLNNGATGADLIVNGTFLYRANSTNTITFATNATWVLGANATIIKTNTASAVDLRDDYEGGISTIPATSNWICRYNGDGNVTLVGLNMFYPIFTIESTAGAWDASTLASKFTGGTGFTTVKGNMDIGGTGTGTVTIYNEANNTQPMLILGNLTVRAGSTLTNNGSADKGRGFELKGNLTVNGTLTVNATDVNVTSPILKFSNTTGEQTISGTTGSVTLYELDVNKIATFDLKLLRSITVDGLVDLQIGDLNLNGFNVDMGANGVLSENLPSNYLAKDLTATTEANKGGYIRFSNRPISNAQTNIGGSRILLNRTAGGDYSVNIDRYHYRGDYGKAIRLIYQVAVNAGTLDATNPTNLRINYADDEAFAMIEPLDVSRWSSATGWQNFVADLKDAPTNYAQRNGITAFSHWTLSDTNVPLASADLKATQVGEQASFVQWQASVGKAVLQKSLDGIAFHDLASPDQTTYTDIQFTTNAYYRLKFAQNNTLAYSNSVFLIHEASQKIGFYPNPFTNQDKLTLVLPTQTEVKTIRLIDAQGKLIAQTNLANLPATLRKVANGLYILQIQTDKAILYLKIVKQ